MSAEITTPLFPSQVFEPVLDLLSRLGVVRHGQSAVLRALSRAERAPETTAELGEFLRNQRARRLPEPGAVWSGTRRVPGMRREEVAQLAGVRCRLHTLCAPNAGCSANVP
ncbi:hypothetical protein [Nocardia lijiangensis]|uniref:hypothetical protein n=1 Tax=Nocardia lijiangensis TaxID=299618 RepID=UPI0008364386|nr:hypothetical protein [Nocardia lijiangensis]